MLRTSFKAVVLERAKEALVSSGQYSSVDSRIICTYLENKEKKVEFRFEHPEYKWRLELYGVEGRSSLKVLRAVRYMY